MGKKRYALVVAFLGALLTIGVMIYNISIYHKVDTLEKTGNFVFHYRGMLLILGLVLLVAGLLRLPTKKHSKIVNFIFLLPVCITFFVTVLIPFALGLLYSMTDWNGIEYNTFVGFDNYLEIFSASDFTYSFFITFIYTAINAVVVNVVAFFLALLVTSNIKGGNFYKAAYFVPNLIGGIVLGYVWQFVFNKVFTELIPGSNSMLANPNTALAAIVIVSTWQYAGYIMMIYVTGLQGIPKSVIEAASIDGAKGRQSLVHITLPMIANAFTVCTFLTLVNSFKQFDLNYAITNGGPTRIIASKAVFSTEFLALNIYKTAIVKNSFALGQAKAILFFVIIAFVALVQVTINKKKEVEL